MEPRRSGLGGLGGDGLSDVLFGDGFGRGADRVLDNGKDAPALEATERTGLHDLDLVADLGLVFLIVRVHDGLTIDDLVVERVWCLVRDGDLDGLVTGATGDETPG